MSNPEKFYLTTPIYYVNARPHIGHAYTTIVADAIARRKRALGFDTWFLTGTDEHGQKIERSAKQAGIDPQHFTDKVSAEFRSLWDRMGLTYDDFIRTTEPRHHASSIAIWERMEKAGDIYLDKYSGWYSVRDEAYYDESETRLDDKGTRLGPNNTPVEWVEEESYFFFSFS